MFFASRFSALLGVRYRSAMIRDLVGVRRELDGSETDLGRLLDLDTSGVGVRMALAIGL
jgi:hypothetical protein